jgi:hypothetical protein
LNYRTLSLRLDQVELRPSAPSAASKDAWLAHPTYLLILYCSTIHEIPGE